MSFWDSCIRIGLCLNEDWAVHRGLKPHQKHRWHVSRDQPEAGKPFAEASIGLLLAHFAYAITDSLIRCFKRLAGNLFGRCATGFKPFVGVRFPTCGFGEKDTTPRENEQCLHSVVSPF